MPALYRLHYAPDNASLIVRMALLELGQPFETALVDRARQGQKSPAFLALNPNGLIPVLETPDGPIFETGAILLWLADRHGRMAPAPDAPERAEFLKWLFFTSNTLHSQLRMTFYPASYAGDDPAAQGAMVARLQAQDRRVVTLPGALALLDDRYARRPDETAPTTPSVLDYYIATLLRWCALYPRGGTGWFDIRAYPALWDLAEELENRPATRAAMIAEGLGPTPFTAPRHATPPEGSAT